jgi:predicted RNase H-like nuclease (RuvC/YqgF family)
MCASIPVGPSIPPHKGEVTPISCKVFINGREIEPGSKQWDQTMKDLIQPLFKHFDNQGQPPDLVIRAEHLKPEELETIDHGKSLRLSPQIEQEAVKTLQTLKQQFGGAAGKKEGVYEVEVRIAPVAPQPKAEKKATLEEDFDAWMKETEKMIAASPVVEGLGDEKESLERITDEKPMALIMEIEQTIKNFRSLIDAVQETEPSKVSAQTKRQFGTTLKQVEGQLIAAQDTIHGLEKKVATLTEKTERLQGKLREEKKSVGLESELHTLQETIAESDQKIKGQEGEIMQLKRQLKTLKGTNQELSDNLKISEERVRSLEDNLRGLQQHPQPTSDTQNLEKALKERDKDIDRLTQELQKDREQLQYYDSAFGEEGIEGFTASMVKVQQENERYKDLLHLMNSDEKLGPAMAEFLKRLQT